MKLSVPTIHEQTGYVRPMDVSICQDGDYLMRVEHYDFDLSNTEFQSYCRGRGVLYKAGSPGSRRWQFTADHAAGEADFKGDPYFQRAQPSPQHPEGLVYSNSDMETHWQIMLIAKGAFQDCWELWLNRCREKPELARSMRRMPPTVNELLDDLV